MVPFNAAVVLSHRKVPRSGFADAQDDKKQEVDL
jgi:hypothetical protein